MSTPERRIPEGAEIQHRGRIRKVVAFIPAGVDAWETRAARIGQAPWRPVSGNAVSTRNRYLLLCDETRKCYVPYAEGLERENPGALEPPGAGGADGE